MEASTTERMTYSQARQSFRDQTETALRVLREYLTDINAKSWDEMSDEDRADCAAILTSELPLSIAQEFLNESGDTVDDLHLLVRLIERPSPQNAEKFWMHFRANAIQYAKSFVDEQLWRLG